MSSRALKRDYPYQTKKCIADIAELSVFADTLAREISAGLTIGLSGDLGAGKTTLVRFLVKALGSFQPVSSPTYALQHEYCTNSGLVIEHWDLYRLSSAPEELHERCPQNHLRLIEWPEKADEIMAEIDIFLTLALINKEEENNSRELSIESRKLLML